MGWLVHGSIWSMISQAFRSTTGRNHYVLPPIFLGSTSEFRKDITDITIYCNQLESIRFGWEMVGNSIRSSKRLPIFHRESIGNL